MRKRVNRACIASSSNYSSSKKLHRQMLQENHDTNNHVFLAILSKETKKEPINELVSFENGLKKQIEMFRSKR